MELAKKKIDVGLSTNNLDPMLHFWQNDVGLRFDHVLPVRRGQKQYRHDAAGSVIKINHHVDQLPVAPPSGYRELIIAREDRAEPERLTDPDGNRTCLVPLGHEGINQMTTLPKTLTSKIAIIAGGHWDVAFWFAVLSPVLGILAGFLALFVFYR